MSRVKTDLKKFENDAPMAEAAQVDAPAAETLAAAPPENAAIKNSPAPSAKGKQEVRARIHFTDALTGKSFQPNDLVEGWPEEREVLYANRGLVYFTIAVGPSEFK